MLSCGETTSFECSSDFMGRLLSEWNEKYKGYPCICRYSKNCGGLPEASKVHSGQVHHARELLAKTAAFKCLEFVRFSTAPLPSQKLRHSREIRYFCTSSTLKEFMEFFVAYCNHFPHFAKMLFSFEFSHPKLPVFPRLQLIVSFRALSVLIAGCIFSRACDRRLYSFARFSC